jgi:peptide/nickel transport system substrate-binding protein
MVDAAALLRPIGTGELVSGPFVPSSPFYNHQVAPQRPDPAQATALLTEAGCQRSGARWSCGAAPLALKVAAPRGMESAQEVVIQLQAQLREQGVETELVFLDEAAWKASVWRDRDFDLVLSQWTFDRNEDVREQLHSQGARNFVGYSNPEVDRLLDQARAAVDPQDKKLALREVHRLVAADAPMRFLWTLDSFAALSADISNVVIHPFYFFTWLQRWKRG